MVWIPKCRRKTLYGELRKYQGEVFRELAMQKESKIVEGHLMLDHVHMLISIPPKYAVAQAVGFIRGKRAIHIAQTLLGRKKNFTGQNFCSLRVPGFRLNLVPAVFKPGECRNDEVRPLRNDGGGSSRDDTLPKKIAPSPLKRGRGDLYRTIPAKKSGHDFHCFVRACRNA